MSFTSEWLCPMYALKKLTLRLECCTDEVRSVLRPILDSVTRGRPHLDGSTPTTRPPILKLGMSTPL